LVSNNLITSSVLNALEEFTLNLDNIISSIYIFWYSQSAINTREQHLPVVENLIISPYILADTDTGIYIGERVSVPKSKKRLDDVGYYFNSVNYGWLKKVYSLSLASFSKVFTTPPLLLIVASGKWGNWYLDYEGVV